jgi:glyoxylase-like metal-dependent hydrolase (beta-lactamase superfamily II)
MTRMDHPEIIPYVLGGYQTNCHVVLPRPGATACWIVDCGFEPQQMLQDIARRGLRPVALLLTHCHSDHIAGIDLALRCFGPLPMYVHQEEAGFCSDPLLNLSALGGPPVSVTEPDHLLRDGDVLELEGTPWRVLHAPGHSPGGVIYHHAESEQALVGDTIFAGSIGRHDLPTSDPAQLRRSLLEVVLALPDATRLFPGHGPRTTVGRERRTNPFLREWAARAR